MVVRNAPFLDAYFVFNKSVDLKVSWRESEYFKFEENIFHDVKQVNFLPNGQFFFTFEDGATSYPYATSIVKSFQYKEKNRSNWKDCFDKIISDCEKCKSDIWENLFNG